MNFNSISSSQSIGLINVASNLRIPKKANKYNSFFSLFRQGECIQFKGVLDKVELWGSASDIMSGKWAILNKFNYQKVSFSFSEEKHPFSGVLFMHYIRMEGIMMGYLNSEESEPKLFNRELVIPYDTGNYVSTLSTVNGLFPC